MNFDIRSGEYTFKHRTDTKKVDEYHFLPHFHHSFELYYFISGDGEYIVDNKRYELVPGSILLIRPNIEHQLILHSDKKYERIVIRFPEEDLPEAIYQGLKQKDNFYFIKNSDVENEIKKLDTHFLNIEKDIILLTFKMSLNVILSYIISYKPESFDVITDDERMNKIMHYIDENLLDITSLDSICQSLHVSKSSLSKVFNQYMGVSIMAYIRYRKCSLVNNLIEKGEMPTKAYKTSGFNDYSAFYRAYVKVFKHAPSYEKRKNGSK